MITEQDITKAGDDEKQSAQSYLEGVMDSMKWTSTLSIAALLWIGNNIGSVKAPFRSILAVSLIFLIFSLIIAIITVRDVLMARNTKWISDIEHETLLLLKKWKTMEPSEVSDRKENEQIQRLIRAMEASRPFTRPTRFNMWVTLHMIFLVLGLGLYALAQYLTSS